MSDLTAEAIRARLQARRLGRRLVVLDQVGSTLDVLAELAAAGAPEGTVVIADHQTAGRGRFDRSWLAPPGTALLLSLLCRPPLMPERVGQVSMAVALGALDGLAASLPADVPLGLKWPNDVLCRGLKLGGLLAEAAWTPAGRAEVRVGLGLNVGQAPDAVPPGAISLAMVVDRVPGRAALAAAILNAVDGHYGALLAGADLVERWAGHLTTVGQEVVAHTAQGTLKGHATGVTATGALVLRLADGSEQILHAADVSLQGKVPDA